MLISCIFKYFKYFSLNTKKKKKKSNKKFIEIILSGKYQFNYLNWIHRLHKSNSYKKFSAYINFYKKQYIFE